MTFPTLRTRWVIFKTPWWECIAAGVPFLMRPECGDHFAVMDPREYRPPAAFEHDVIMNPHHATELAPWWRQYRDRVSLYETENMIGAPEWRNRSARLRYETQGVRWLNYSAANARAFGDEHYPLRKLIEAPKARRGWYGPVSGGPDVLFVGSAHPRRQAILSELTAAGLFVHAPEPPIFGSALAYHETAAKVVLNIHYYEPGVFESFRVVPAWHRGAKVLSEESVDGEGAEWCECVPYSQLVKRTLELVRGS